MPTSCIGRVRVCSGIRGAVPVSGRIIIVILLLPRRGPVVRVAARIVRLIHLLVVIAAECARHLHWDDGTSEAMQGTMLKPKHCTMAQACRRSTMHKMAGLLRHNHSLKGIADG